MFSNFVDYVVNQKSLGDVTVGTLITFDKFIRNPKCRMPPKLGDVTA